MMASDVLSIADKASRFFWQGPRYRKFGPNSGEEFRVVFLIPFLENLGPEEAGIIDFSGTEAFSPSFLEEAFGGAVRRGYGDKVERLTYINIPPKWKRVLKRYVADALRRQPGFEGGGVMEEAFKECVDCRYYDMREGICISGDSDMLGKYVAGLGACDEYEEEDD